MARTADERRDLVPVVLEIAAARGFFPSRPTTFINGTWDTWFYMDHFKVSWDGHKFIISLNAPLMVFRSFADLQIMRNLLEISENVLNLVENG